MAHDYTAPRRTNESPIAQRRIALGMTQAQLAQKIGCTPVDISRWEKGKHKPGANALVKLSSALSCAIDDII